MAQPEFTSPDLIFEGGPAGAALFFMDAVTAYIALGSNLGDRVSHLQFALNELNTIPGLQIEAVSGVYESAAHVLKSADPQPDYLNAVVQCRVNLKPYDLLLHVLDIESRRGRVRSSGTCWLPRILDIDLIQVGDKPHKSEHLILPHSRLGERAFVLLPLVEIAEDLHIHAPYNTGVRYLLARCTDVAAIERTMFTLGYPPSNEPV